MGLPICSLPFRRWRFWSLSILACACTGSAPDTHDRGEPAISGAGQSAGVTSTGGAGSSGAGNSGTNAGNGSLASGGLAISGSGANGGSASSGAGAGGASGGAAGGAQSGSGNVAGGGVSATCSMVKSEYAAELELQLACTPNAASQCVNKVAAAPGCECRVFIQPADPFAIEHLSNVASGWFDGDCSMPSCPVKCSTAAAGVCQVDPKSPLGGRCITP